ncbi:hypothetical protein KAR91_46175 [Candidatus Pacearchaeota archaeon]|nr:hypothetical protein [Candidatus Pacearchaeota archaeon]
MGILEVISLSLIELYQSFIATSHPYVASLFNLLFLVLLVVIYSVFVWKFYRFIATKNLIELDLSRYNKLEHPTAAKALAFIFYFVEYLLILPFLIFFWFAAFTFFLIILTDNLDVKTLLVISATVIAAIRMTAYYREDLSKDVAKMLPFTLLSVSLLNPGFFDVERIIGHITRLPEFFGEITLYLVLIIGIEMILRFFDFIFSLFGLEEEESEEKTAQL